jgi:hypothetical protein
MSSAIFSAHSHKMGTSSASPRDISVEGVTTGAATLSVRVADHKPLFLQAVHEIDARTNQIRHALMVNHFEARLLRARDKIN